MKEAVYFPPVIARKNYISLTKSPAQGMTGSRLCWCLLRVLLLAGVEWPSLLLPWLRLWGQAEPLPSSSTQLPSPLPQGPAYSLIHFAFGWNVGEHIVFYGDSCPLCRFLMTLMLTLKSWASGKVKTMFRTRRDDHPNNRVEGHHLHLFFCREFAVLA